MKTRQVEMAVCFDNGTWQACQFVDIPADTPDEKVEDVARQALLANIEGDVAGCWLYNSQDDEADEDDTLGREFVLKRMNDAVNGMGGKEIAAMWNEWFPPEQEIKYLGDDLFESVK